MIFKLIAILITAVLILILITYFIEINHARKRVLSGSKIFYSKHGSIEYCDEGNGLPALLIHGAGGGFDQGLFLGRMTLGKGYRFISVSRFGYLRSPFPENTSAEDQAVIYKALLDYLEVEKVILVACSAGGPSALQFAFDYPECSSALVLVSAVTKYMGDDIPISTKIINCLQKYDFTYWVASKFFRLTFLDMIGVSRSAYKSFNVGEKAVIKEMLDIMHPMSKRLSGGLHEAKIYPISAEQMKEIVVPTLILHAKDDKLVNFEHALNAHDNINKSIIIAYDTSGHSLISKNDITEHIKRFLAENV